MYSWQEFESSWPSKNYGVERKRFSLQRRDAISSGSGCQDEAFCQLWLSLARSTVAKSSFPIAVPRREILGSARKLTLAHLSIGN